MIINCYGHNLNDEEFMQYLKSKTNDLTKIISLQCSINRLTFIPKELIGLKILYCAYNNITVIPKELTNITTLHCFNNKLTFIPRELVNLTSLLCFGNKLRTIPYHKLLGNQFSTYNFGFSIKYEIYLREINKCIYLIYLASKNLISLPKDILKQIMTGKYIW